MKSILTSFAAAVICLLGISGIHAQQLAFPGAEGFGRYALGARGVASPQVYHVTNLNDSGTGSLRDAVSQPGRIVVFDVSGVIKLNSRIVFSGNSYIAGQTAPGDGVILYGDGVSFSGANNLIVRYLRVYMGKSGTSGKDASGVANGKSMIFDHLSLMWGLDENFSINWDSKGTEPADITIQHSIIGQGIMTHSAGGLIQTNGGVSIISNLYIDNKTRNPKVKGLNQFINNVVYNWGGSDGYILGDSDGASWAWLEGNYFICGPNSSSPFTRANTNFQLYHKDNYVDKDKDGVANGYLAANSDYGSAAFKASLSAFTNIPKAHPEIAGGILTAQQALEKAIESAGASLPARSQPDAYVIDQLVSLGTKGELITNENNNGIYQNVGVVSNGLRPADTDNDGIPDEWEIASSLNPNNSADATQTAANGYLNIENYINSISAPVAPYVRCASDIKATTRTVNSIGLSWKNNAAASDGIELQQSTDGKTFSTIASLPANATSYTVEGLSEEAAYYFRLITQQAGLSNSTPSEILKTATAGTPKAPYASINPSPAVDAASRFYTEVILSWENETGEWAGNITYDVYFGSSADNLTQIASGLSDLTYTHTNAGMVMNQTYYWRVDATNTLGTAVGTVWSFKAGTYSFVASYVDAGIDFTGSAGTGSRQNAQSGIVFSTSKSYTVKPATNDEMKITVSTGSEAMNHSSNNVYDTKGSIYAAYPVTDYTHYIEDALTANSAKKSIASITINGTSNSVDGGATVAVLFSDKYPFSTTSIIGFETVDLPACRKGENAVSIAASIGAKSFRVYKKAIVQPVDEDIYKVVSATSANTTTLGAGAGPRIAYIGATLELVSDDGVTAIDAQKEDPRSISYSSGQLYNPQQEQILVFNSLGTLVAASKDANLDVDHLVQGVYIARTETGKTLKFIIN
ncbi:MAG: hypothetical protein LBD45_00545 [Bacteroidales bacterium]|jgi:hypothetical protein|nr:hypothetical protein [Bacteroidales bacterium]